MSSIPNAHKSNVSNLTILPNQSDSYPEIDHSNVKSCTFTNLSSSTHIRHSHLKDVKLDGTRVACGGIHRSSVKNTEFIGIGNIDGSTIRDSTIGERTEVIGSSVKRSYLGEDNLVKNCSLDRVSLQNCKVEGSSLRNCYVSNSSFSGVSLKNGIWDRGNLVRHANRNEEVHLMPQSQKQNAQQEERVAESMERAQEVAPEAPSHQGAIAELGSASSTPSNVPLSLHIGPQKGDHLPSNDLSLQTQNDGDITTLASGQLTPSSDGFSDITELIDDDDAHEDVNTHTASSWEKEQAPPPYHP